MSMYHQPDLLPVRKFGLTESSKKLDGSDNVGGKVHVDGDVGGVEDGHGVEDDGVDTCDQCYKTFYVRNLQKFLIS